MKASLKDIVLEENVHVDFGGLDHAGETLGEFLESVDLDIDDLSLEEINDLLEECGIMPIEEDDEEETILEIGKINIKMETFCTVWDGKLYCVDICEDAEERSAWLYNSRYGVKSLMFGYLVNAQSREEFLDLVFSNLPDYIEDYAEQYED